MCVPHERLYCHMRPRNDSASIPHLCRGRSLEFPNRPRTDTALSMMLPGEMLSSLPSSSSFFSSTFSSFLHWVSCNPVWPQTHQTAKGDQEFMILLLPTPSSWITGMYHYPAHFYVVLGTEPRNSLDKYSINRAIMSPMGPWLKSWSLGTKPQEIAFTNRCHAAE